MRGTNHFALLDLRSGGSVHSSKSNSPVSSLARTGGTGGGVGIDGRAPDAVPGTTELATSVTLTSIHGSAHFGHNVSSAGRAVPQCTQIGRCEEVLLMGIEDTTDSGYPMHFGCRCPADGAQGVAGS